MLVQRLQSVMNAAAKIIYSTARVSPLLRQLKLKKELTLS